MTERTIIECDARLASDCPERFGAKNELLEADVVLKSGPWAKPSTRTYHFCFNCLRGLPENQKRPVGGGIGRYRAEKVDGEYKVIGGMAVTSVENSLLDGSSTATMEEVDRADFGPWHDAVAELIEEALPT